MRTLALRLVIFAACTTALLAGCASTPIAAMSDFTSDKAEVRVAYNIMGPSADDARVAADPVGKEHCTTEEKETRFISARQQRFDSYNGEYVFLYRCEGADRVVIED